MNSLLLYYAARFLSPVLLIFSVVLLLRGHHLPGGGFVGGLIASSAFVLYVLGGAAAQARTKLRVEPHFLMGIGLLMAAGSGIVSFFFNAAFLTGFWAKITWGGFTLEIGTPFFFDVGVYLIVLGTALMIFFHLEEPK